MARKRQKPAIGARPGTLVIDPSYPAPRIRLIRYSKESIEETDVTDADSLRGVPESSDCCWIDVQGLGDLRTIEKLGRIFSIHPLALEDIVHFPIRPKTETYDDNLLIVVRMLQLKGGLDVESEQVSLLVGHNYVVSFQQQYGDVLDPIRARLRAGNRMIRTAGPGYLAYAIIDTIVDAYHPVTDHFADLLEEAEELVMTDPTSQTLRHLNRLKNVLVRIRRAVAPQREAVNTLVRDESEFIDQNTRMFLRDTYDHCVLTSEAVETSREFVNGLMNTYLTVVSNRMNDVMKTLTIVASIFVPLTFMAGIYGMNFESMPELHWRWSYPALVLAMAIVAGGMILYFRRKGWIGPADTGESDDDR